MSVSAPYYGDSAVMRTPPPDLPSLLLKERIVYLGLPLFSDDDAKRQMGIDVTELIIAQLLYLEFDNPEKPIFFYINSTGTSWYSGDAIGFETEAFAIADTLRIDPTKNRLEALVEIYRMMRPGAPAFSASVPIWKPGVSTSSTMGTLNESHSTRKSTILRQASAQRIPAKVGVVQPPARRRVDPIPAPRTGTLGSCWRC